MARPSVNTAKFSHRRKLKWELDWAVESMTMPFLPHNSKQIVSWLLQWNGGAHCPLLLTHPTKPTIPHPYKQLFLSIPRPDTITNNFSPHSHFSSRPFSPMLKFFDCSLRIFAVPLSVATIWLTVTNQQDNTSYGKLEFSNLSGLK